MPTYQYACTACGEQHEAVQAFTDAPLLDCPACSGRLRKVFSAVGVVFKGTGFYKTDSRKASDSKDGAAVKTDAGAAGKTDSGAAGRTDGAGAAKSSDSGKSDSGSSRGTSAGPSSTPTAGTPAAKTA